MKKDKVRICNICHLTVDESKEFARFTHFKYKDEVLSEAFYHVNCFRKRMHDKEEIKKLQKEADSVLKFAKEKLGIPDVVNI